MATFFQVLVDCNGEIGAHSRNQHRLQDGLCMLRRHIEKIAGSKQQRRRLSVVLLALLFVYSGLILLVQSDKPLGENEQLAQSQQQSPVAVIEEPKKAEAVKPVITAKPKKAPQQKPKATKPPAKKKQLAAVKKAAPQQAPVQKKPVQAPLQQEPPIKEVVAVEPEQEQQTETQKIPSSLSGFTKLDNAGNVLSKSELQWNCVRDEGNGLVWENKTDDGSVQDRDHSFTWYQVRPHSEDASSVSTSGVADGGRCKGGIACDTQSYVRAMNEKKLCGYSDWRLPTKEELQTLVTFQQDRAKASIDNEFFPHAVPSWYWTASENRQKNEYAWYVLFRNGLPLNDLKKRPKHVRLVRSMENSALYNRELAQE